MFTRRVYAGCVKSGAFQRCTKDHGCDGSQNLLRKHQHETRGLYTPKNSSQKLNCSKNGVNCFPLPVCRRSVGVFSCARQSLVLPCFMRKKWKASTSVNNNNLCWERSVQLPGWRLVGQSGSSTKLNTDGTLRPHELNTLFERLLYTGSWGSLHQKWLDVALGTWKILKVVLKTRISFTSKVV